MEAHRSTQDKLWTRRARQSFGWFLGNNDMQAVMYDFQTGGCSDGLTPDGASLNQGAESLLAWLISLLTIQGMSHAYGERDIDRGEEREETTPARSN